jgi:hypothetical protein
MLGIKPGILCMTGKLSTTEFHCHPSAFLSRDHKDISQVVKHLPSKFKTVSSNPSTAKKREGGSGSDANACSSCEYI